MKISLLFLLLLLLIGCSIADDDIDPSFLNKLLIGNPWHDWYYDMLDSFVKDYQNQHNAMLNFVEIGVCYGTHVDHLLSQTENITVYGVDPYLSQYDPLDFVANSGDQAHFDKIHKHVMHKLKFWIDQGRYHHKRLRSWDAVTDFEDESVDIIFVDGDHRYRAVLTDIEDWWPKVRKQGVMLGDDYEFDDRYGVKQAVDEFVETNNLQLQFLENDKHKIWYIIKPN